ncbi:MAG TPA: DUF3418 domain-containing protein, partial [Burkholderiales bacterium]|nr:DUF3418 domain-containing protein [Burkholderiales bacterium]
KRRVHYGPLNPAEAREIFIRHALVAGEFQSGGFLAHNQRLIREVQELEHKARRRDVLVDEEAIYAFYDASVPSNVYNGAAFERWRREAEAANPGLLFVTREYLMRHAASEITEAQFPDVLHVAGVDFKLRYRFDPGHPLDGITVTVPLHLLNQLDAAPFEWLVPGLIREKVNACLKALPKGLRKHLFPLPEQVTAFLLEQDSRIEDRGSRIEGKTTDHRSRFSFKEALRRFLQRRIGEPVPEDAWDDTSLPAYLRMNFRVIDESGRELAMGRDLPALKTQLGQAAQLTFGKAEPGIERANIRAWDFGDLPEEIAFTRGGRKLTGYPALADEGESVAIRLFDVRQAAGNAMRKGVLKLLRLSLKEQMRQLEKNPPGYDHAALQLRSIVVPEQLKQDLLQAITDRAFLGEDELPRTGKAFEAQRARARTRLPAVTDAAGRLLGAIADEYHRVSLKLAGARGALSRPATDIRAQLSRLLYPGFFADTPWEQLAHVPRYLKAMQLRLDKYGNDPERDAKHAQSIAELWKRYEERLEKQKKAGAADPRLDHFRWQLEELRVSLFAQELKTPAPVSYKRLEKMWNAMR